LLHDVVDEDEARLDGVGPVSGGSEVGDERISGFQSWSSRLESWKTHCALSPVDRSLIRAEQGGPDRR
jgi:hypothetical protein